MKKLAILLTLGLMTMLFAGNASAQSFPATGTAVTNAIIQNLATGNGEVATLMISYYNEAGALQYTNSTTVIDPKAVVEVKTADEPLNSAFSGAAIISSDRPIGAVTSVRYTDVPGASDGTTQGAYNGAAAGAETIFFPSFWSFEFIVSRITVQNTENTTANIALDYFDRDGNSVGTKTDTIAGFGSKTYCACSGSSWPGGTIPNDFVDGSVTVRSTNGVKLAGASIATRGSSTSAYQALTAADQGTTLYAPSAFRFNVGNPVVQGSAPVLLSAVNIQNTSTTTAAQVEVEYYNRDTGNLDLTVPISIPAGSAIGLNTWNGASVSASTFNALAPDGDWDGAVKIISTNDIPLVGTGITRFGVSDRTTMYALVPQELAADEIFMPAQYRLNYGSGDIKQSSSLNLQNVGANAIDTDDITIQYIDNNGNLVKTFSGTELAGLTELAAGSAIGLNTLNGGDLNASQFNVLGTGFIGGIYVTSPGAELVATSNIIYNNRASSYNGITK